MKKKIWFFTKSKEGRKLLDIEKDIIVVLFQSTIKFSTFLAPNNFPQSAWNNVWADIFVQAFGIYDGTKNFMIKHLKQLFSKTKNPSLGDLYQQIKYTKYPLMSRYARYQESALNRLGGILSSPISNVIDCRDISIELFSNYNVIFEIQYLTSEQQVFIVNILLSWLYYYKLYNEIELTHFVGIDDANLVFDKSFENRPDRGLPIISHLLSTVRKSKINVICCSQIPHQLGASIHSNSFTKIMFNLANGKDIECMIQSMGITDSEQRQYCYQLDLQEMVIKFSARYQEPFLAYVPFTSFSKEKKSHEDIKINNRRILSFFQKEPEKEQVTIQPDEGKDKKETLDTVLKQFLTEVYNHPLHSITQHYSNLNLSAGKGNRIVKTLVNQDLLKIIEINLGGRGGLTKFLEITEQGYKAIKMPILKYTRGTGFEHWFWQNKISKNFEKLKDCEVTIEANLKGKSIDILLDYNNEIKTAIEISISTNPHNEKGNVIKDLDVGVDLVIVAYHKEKVDEMERMINSLEEKYRDRAVTCSLPELLKSDKIFNLINFNNS